GKVLLDSLKVPPMPVLIGTTEYPGDVIDRIRTRAKSVLIIEAHRKAKELGQSKAQNTVMLGALSTQLELPTTAFEKAIRENVKPRFLDANLRAYQEGQRLALALKPSSHHP
ncbi:MAG: 2-oxoacid:acceptor oxidoreductase family protein, partial [candidate division WOR-3 bacterium]